MTKAQIIETARREAFEVDSEPWVKYLVAQQDFNNYWNTLRRKDRIKLESKDGWFLLELDREKRIALGSAPGIMPVDPADLVIPRYQEDIDADEQLAAEGARLAKEFGWPKEFWPKEVA